MTDSNSLLACILKAKYFPCRDFLDVPLGHNPSYIRRSLWSTQSLYTLGHRWKIGGGSKINLWYMPWIQSLPHLQELTVSQLLNTDSLSWNYMLILSIFNPQDVVIVNFIPLHVC